MNATVIQLLEKLSDVKLKGLVATEALKKKLPTKNTMYGLYGELRRQVPGQQDALWQAISNGLHDAYPSYGLPIIRNFLDSSYGRDLFDLIKHLIVNQDEINLDDIRETVRAAVASDKYQAQLQDVVKSTEAGVFDDSDDEAGKDSGDKGD